MIQTELFSTDNCGDECRGNNFAICHTEYPFSDDWSSCPDHGRGARLCSGCCQTIVMVELGPHVEGLSMAPAVRFRGEYLLLSIIPTGSRPKRSMPWIATGVLIALLGTVFLLVLGQ
jgi:hypothetical protein